MSSPRDALLPRARLVQPQPLGLIEREFQVARSKTQTGDLDLKDPEVRKAIVRLIRAGT